MTVRRGLASLTGSLGLRIVGGWQTRHSEGRKIMGRHWPPCHAANAPDYAAAPLAARHPEQGWSLLCDGLVIFDDTENLSPH